MKALCTDGGVEGLTVRELPVPEPGPGQVRVRVRASALNPADEKVLSGQFIGNILHGKQRPLVTGWDLAGTVDAVGPGADFAIGDEVFGFLAYARSTRRGAFAEQVVAPASALARRPPHLSPGDACALATAGVSALQSLRDIAGVKTGQRVLVVGASGGVGSLAVGVAVKLGAIVTGICSASAADFVRSLGASSILVRGQVDPLLDEQRYDAILDAAVVYSFGKMKHLLNPGGTFVSTLPSPGLFLSMPVAKLLGKRVGFLARDEARGPRAARGVGRRRPEGPRRLDLPRSRRRQIPEASRAGRHEGPRGDQRRRRLLTLRVRLLGDFARRAGAISIRG